MTLTVKKKTAILLRIIAVIVVHNYVCYYSPTHLTNIDRIFIYEASHHIISAIILSMLSVSNM